MDCLSGSGSGASRTSEAAGANASSAALYFLIMLFTLIVCPDSSVMSPGCWPGLHAPAHSAVDRRFRFGHVHERRIVGGAAIGVVRGVAGEGHHRMCGHRRLAELAGGVDDDPVALDARSLFEHSSLATPNPTRASAACTDRPGTSSSGVWPPAAARCCAISSHRPDLRIGGSAASAPTVRPSRRAPARTWRGCRTRRGSVLRGLGSHGTVHSG